MPLRSKTTQSKDLNPNHTYSLSAQIPDWTPKNYLHVSNIMARFVVATAEELAANGDCAICLDSMLTACKLPCGHLYHNSCLRSWLEQDNSCPTCSTSLDISGDGALERSQQQGAGVEENMGPVGAAADARPHINPHNWFFHFDGSLIASWLPSFLLGVIHTPNGERRPSDQRPEWPRPFSKPKAGWPLNPKQHLPPFDCILPQS